MDGKKFWAATPTAKNNLDLVLGSVRNLALRYWRKNFFFRGARDLELLALSSGRFPATTSPGKTHPVFTLQRLPDSVGFISCPCSSQKPFHAKRFRYIRKGCQLRHTGHWMGRNSYLVEAFRLNIPVSMAGKLRFIGEVPPQGIALVQKGAED